MTSYPGKLIDDETGFRILKCYIYKFIRHRIDRRPRFDAEENGLNTKRYFWFNTWRPLSGSYHNDKHVEKLEGLWFEEFILEEPKVYFMPQYTEEKISKKRRATYFNAQAKKLRTTCPP